MLQNPQRLFSSLALFLPCMPRRIKFLFAYLLMPLLLLFPAACSGPEFIDFITPREGYRLHRNLAYGDHPRQQLDVYVPSNMTGSAPVMMFFYGGSWQKGSKDEYRFVGQAFAAKGYVVVIADYRLYPEVHFPEFMHDAAKALRWAHENIAGYGGDPENLFLAGHSAGGYIATMLTVNPRYIREAGGATSWIRGSIGIAGPYDFLPFTDPKIKDIFSKMPDRLTQPIHFVKAHLPPILLLTGDADEDVLPRNSLNLAAKLQRYQNEVTVKTYPNVAHIGVVLALANGFRYKAPVLEDIDAFVRAHRTQGN